MKKITFFIYLLLFSFVGLNAQIITIGTGTSTQRYPLGNYFGYERSASIYTAAEIGSSGNIVNLSWQANTAGAARPIVVYLMETSSPTLTAGTWANQISGATQVFSGTVTPAVGWNTINLSVPFNYTGGSNNLMVLVEANFGGGGNGAGAAGNSVRYSAATSQHEYWQQDTNVPTGNGTVTNNRPNIQITYDTQCSGTPVAGTVMPVSQNLCTGATPAALVATGTVVYLGTSFQWEESDDNGVGDAWAPVVGGSGANTTTYTPPTFSGTPIYYRLNVTCTNSGLSGYSTIVSIQNPIVPATQASTLNFTNTLYTNTTASWTNGNGGRRLVIVSNNASITDPVSASGQPANTANAVYAGSGQQIVYDGTGTSVSVSGLTCNATYYFKVYEYVRCGSGPYDYYYNVTSGTNVASVLTSQPSTATLPVNNTFSGFTGANLSTVFPGWYEAAIATAAGSTPSDSAPGGSTSSWTNSTVFGSSAKLNLFTNTRNEWIVGPKVTLTAASRLKFRAAITDYNVSTPDPVGMAGTDDKVDVLISTDACGSSWTVLQTFNAANTTTLTNALTDYLFDLSAYTGQTVQIAFRGSDGPLDDAPDYDFHIANVLMELIPACNQPIGLSANNVTYSSANLLWTAGGSETLWNVQWGASGFALGTGTIVNGVANTYPLSGLAPNTSYQYYAQADCAASGTSTWSGPFTFYTGYCLPSGTNASTYVNSFTTTGGGVNISNTASGLSTNNYGDFYAVNSVSQAPNQAFNFEVAIVGGTVGCAIWVDWNNNLQFESSERVYNTTSYGNGPFTGSITIPNGTANGSYGMRVLIDWNALNPANPCGFVSGRGEVEDYKLIVDSALSSVSFDSTSFKAYPNPVKDVLNLSYSSEISSVEVYNMLGQNVLTKTLNVAQGQIDMSNLNSGNYIVKVTADGLTKTIKVIKK
ncbi:hypothetical protein FLJC2902T_24370 [Flavobacterium limnosediminis JC2902]|uniref:Fibronectin type-III domain-containing protein n=1 Tax=Flavobacterium limnosediminis JC2902 TaxID=1341181 RepID=V6SID2_9FLAO|nr:GEVED domain-containing protein [Flavobacterium limnosediminis]ESU26468.1 hypothetical protein FLJC2902T_24370 [Flavobacterium limnosediminis JC2902]